MPANPEITRLIQDWQRGDRGAEQALFDLLYKNLRDIALHCLRTERANQTVGATALVHEAYLRFSNSERLQIADRNHFLSLAARVMRRILVDRARARQADRRGGDPVRVEVTSELVQTEAEADKIISVDRALESLARQSTRQAELVELIFFAGHTLEAAAEILGISSRTARREWKVARTRLRGAIDGVA